MLPEAGPTGATHGFVAGWQTWPTLALPFSAPFTDHVTLVSAVFATDGVNDIRWLTESVAEGGETLTLTLLVTVRVADAVAPSDGVTAA